MSFFGGGSDVPAHFKKHGGAVLSTTFDKYCYVNARHLPRFFSYSTELSYSRIERVSSLEDIEHPVIREAMRLLDMREIRLTYEGDLPARTGLGTSSSFAVGMLQAFHSLKGSYKSPKELAQEAIHLERELCDEAGGWQDQIAAAFGGFNRIDFSEEGFEVSPVIIYPEKKRELENNLLLFFTGFTRTSAEIQKSTRFDKKTETLNEMVSLVDEAQQLLTNKSSNLSRFGELLNYSWQLKRSIEEKVSPPYIDAIYEKGVSHGATGGKLLGAGGGGFLLFYVEPDAQECLRNALSDLLEIPFNFEDKGSRVIFCEPEEYDLG